MDQKKIAIHCVLFPTRSGINFYEVAVEMAGRNFEHSAS
jgi:hypothetical protein